MARNTKSTRSANTPGGGSRTSSKKNKSAGRRQTGDDAPAAVSSRGLAAGPTISGGPRGQTTFSNTEYVADVVTSPTLSNTLTINPANATTFPWLSKVAAGFEVYRFRQLTVTFTPSCSSQTSGMIVGAFDFDGNDPAPTSKVQISAMDSSARGNIWGKTTFRMACPNGWYYTSEGGGPGDVRLTDVARFFFGTYGYSSGAGQIVGELSVSYTIELAKPDATLIAQIYSTAVSGSTLSSLPGDVSSYTGDAPFIMAAPSSGVVTMEAKIAGQYTITMVLTLTASANPGSMFNVVQVLRAGAVIATLAATTGYESSSSYVAAGATCYGLAAFFPTLMVGDKLSIAAAAAITSMAINRYRATRVRTLLA